MASSARTLWARSSAAARTAASPATIASSTRAAASSSSRRAFHSYDHPPSSPDPFTRVERAILAAAYAHVPEHGFSARALGLGAKDAGFPDISPAGFVDDGPFSLIRYHLVTQRLALAQRAQHLFPETTGAAAAAPGQQPGVGARVAALTWERLAANKDTIHRWQEALAVMAQPSCVPASVQELAKLSDEIWFLAGDKAVDSSWYTKRASLSMVYSSSELFMTNDHSPGFVDTQHFLTRRLNEVQSFGGVVGSLGQWAGFTASAGINILRSKGVRI